MNKEDLRVGMRVELHLATDQWMQGDRYGEVTHIFDGYARVRLDVSRKSYNVQFRNILKKCNMQYETFVTDHEVFEDPKAEEIWLNQFGAQGYSLVGVMPFTPNDSDKARYYFARQKVGE